jgi:hypothetical protein
LKDPIQIQSEFEDDAASDSNSLIFDHSNALGENTGSSTAGFALIKYCICMR